MNALVYNPKNKTLQYKDMPHPTPSTHDVRVKLKTAGLNRRDLFLINSASDSLAPYILGSDGAGIVDSVGDYVTNVAPGDSVIINPSLGWPSIAPVPDSPQILGSPSNGTFAEYVLVPEENLIRKPDFLTWEESGTLSLSALTAYRALFTKGNLQHGQHVLIPGIGGGVATFALMFAKAIGAQVTVTSRHHDKLEKARTIGADICLHSGDDWKKTLGPHKVDLILDSIGPATFPRYFDILKPNGTIVNFGKSSGPSIQFSLWDLFSSQFNILGTSMGSKEEFDHMMHFVSSHSIRPVIDQVFPLHDYESALSRMQQSQHFGNLVFMIEG